MIINVKLDAGAKLPTYAHYDDAGMDLYAMHGIYIVPARGRATIPTGVHIAIPYGNYGAIRAKSGLLSKHGLLCSGTVDCGYTGEVMVTLLNCSDEDYMVSGGDKVEQMIITPYEHAFLGLVDELRETERGSSGFGSTGK